MTVTSNRNIDVESNETSYHSYVLRVWRDKAGNFKGYVLDPITNKTYPFIPRETSFGDVQLMSGVLIEPLGCWLGMCKPPYEGGEPD